MELLYVQEGSAANLLNKIKLIKTKLIRCNWYQQGGSAATPLPDQIQLKVFVTDRVKLPTSFIPKKDRLWLKTKKISGHFLKNHFFCVFFHRFSPGPTGIKGATDQMLPWSFGAFQEGPK